MRAKTQRLPLRISLVFDGGSHGNPGPAYGSYLLRGTRMFTEKATKRNLGHGTNNEAEYRSLILGLQALLKIIEQNNIEPRQVELVIRGDSQLVLNQLSGEWKAKNLRLRALRDQALGLLKSLGAVSFVHQDRWQTVEVLGH